jgi:hypothetical protein
VFITRLYALNLYNILILCLFVDKKGGSFFKMAVLVQQTSLCVDIFIYSYYPEMAALAIFGPRLQSEYVGECRSEDDISHRRLKKFC